MVSREKSTLPGRDYHAAEVFDLERERIFARNWFYAGRAEGLDEAGDFQVVDVAGESVIVVRTKEGDLRGFYNVCRHRGSRLCDETSGRMKGAVKCPYHAWAYSFDGRLIGTPNVAKDEIDRDALVSGECPSMSGRASCLSNWTPIRYLWRSRFATSTTRRCRSPASTSMGSASATRPSTRSRPTGRS